jgi:hypothetical protein
VISLSLSFCSVGAELDHTPQGQHLVFHHLFHALFTRRARLDSDPIVASASARPSPLRPVRLPSHLAVR